MAKPTLNLLCFSGDRTQCENPVIGTSSLSANLTTFGTGYFPNSKGAVYIPKITTLATDSWDVDFTMSNEGCVEGWFKSDGWSCLVTTPTDGLHHRVFTEVTAAVYIYIHASGGLECGIAGQILHISNIGLLSDTWTHFAFTWSKSLGLVRCYIDGVLKGSASKVLSPTLTDYTLQIGSHPSINYQGWGGWLDGVRFWNEYKTDFKYRNKKRTGMNDYTGI